MAASPFGGLKVIDHCSDQRWLSLGVLNEARQMPGLLDPLGRSDLLGDPWLATVDTRRTHSAALIALFDEAFAGHEQAAWHRRLDGAGITFGVVGPLGDVDDDPQMRACGALVPFEHGQVLTVARPIQLDRAPQRRPASAPGLGQHGLAALRVAGLSAGQAQQPVAQGVVRQQGRSR